MKRHAPPWIWIPPLLAAVLTISVPTPVSSATRTWDGGGATDDWSDPDNWDTGAPDPGDDLQFGGATRLTPNNDLSDGVDIVAFGVGDLTFVFGALPFTLDGGPLSFGNSGSTIANDSFIGQTIDTDLLLLASATSDAVDGPLLYSGDITIDATSTFTFTSGGVIGNTVDGQIRGSGSITQAGGGILSLRNPFNSYGGNTRIEAGTLEITTSGAIPDTSVVTLLVGATFNLNGNNETVGGLSGSGIVGTGGAMLTVASRGLNSFVGEIIGNGGLTKEGDGEQRLLAAQEYLGPTTINNGTLTIGGVDDVLRESSGVTVNSNGLLRLDGGISGTVQSIASLSGAGDVLFVVSAGDQLIVGLDNSSTTFSGDTSGGGALTKTGSGTLTVSGRLNHGSTFVQQGTLHLEDAESTGFVSLQSGGTLSGSGLNRGRIFGDIGSFVSATGGFASFGDATTTSGFFHEGSLDVNTSTTLLLDADKAELGSSTTLAGGGRLVTLNGAQIGTGESLTASGSATIDGNFTNGGTVNGPAGGDQLTFTDDVDGDGNYTGNILFSDGFSPGASPAQISLENVEFDSSSELLIELGGYVPGDDHDQLVVSGDVVLGGSLVVETLGLFTLDSFDQFTIIDVTTGTLSGTFAGLAEGALVPIAGSIPATISYVGGTGNDVVLTGVPEPATCSLGWPLVTALLWRRSRKTRCVG